MNGPYATYDQTGKIRTAGNYVNGTKNGEWHIYDEAGRETETLLYYYDILYESKRINKALGFAGGLIVFKCCWICQ